MYHVSAGKARRIITILLCLILTAQLAPAFAAHAAEPRRVVRVGWYESPFNSTDKSGRRSGYAYEYQLKIAAYSGWEYNYISGSWAELMDMLDRGEIDLMSDVSYTEERAERMLFSDLPMGTEEYCIFISPANREITPEDYTTLNGKRIGVNRGSVQIDLYRSWAQRHEVEAKLVELTCSEDESLDKLETGELDAYITLNAFDDPARLSPVCKIGSSDFYFVVGPSRPELLNDLNAAMNRIRDEDPYYNQRMYEKYVQRFGTNAFLKSDEAAWLDEHGAIRVGYQDNYLAFCAKDPSTGELTGALKDYLDYASGVFGNAEVEFVPMAFSTSAEALTALRSGEVDCVFPANFSSYDGEEMNMLLTSPLMSTDVYAIVRESDSPTFHSKEHVVVAVNEGNPNYNAFLKDNYPGWRTVCFPTTADCLKAVSESVADCVLISSYRYNNISRLCKKYDLTTYVTGAGLDYCFAVSEDNVALYSILAKITGLVPDSAVNSALSYYIAEDAKLTFPEFIADNLVIVAAAVGAVVLLILFLLFYSMRSAKKAKALISVTETDDLTGLYNRDYFFEYAEKMYRDHPEIKRDAIVLNIDQFHLINAQRGWEFGDRVLCILGAELGAVAKERDGIGGRFGADRFDIYCRHTDDYHIILDRMQAKLDTLAPGSHVRLRMGVMPWQPNIEPIQLFDRARTACGMARGNYLEPLVIFDECVRERELRDQRLLGDLRRARDNFELQVYYQPKYDISKDEPRLIGAEALIRWDHPELGMLAPDSFIPLFERNGKIAELDRYVWSQAARQIAAWRAEYGVTLPVSVNLSRVDVFAPDLERTLDGILAQNGLEHGALKLEVTETAYTEDADRLIGVVESLRRNGYVVEMDDFGTGYSSLNMLSSMPVDVLKMDRTFIRNIEFDERDVQLVALILGIAKNLDIPVVAEGVETEGQMKLLRELGCSFVQGFYFSRPLHPSDFEAKILQTQQN